MSSLHRLETFSDAGDLRVVVECPRGAGVKLKLDPEIGAMTLVRPLPQGIVFPFDFGFVPGTLADDGDPLDAMVLSDAASFPGVVVACRPIAVVEASQRRARRGTRAGRGVRVRNDRLICVAVGDARAKRMKDARDVPERVREEISAFFLAAVAFEGKDVDILRWADAGAARRAIDRARAKAT